MTPTPPMVQYWKAAVCVLFLFSCGPADEEAGATHPAPPQGQFWTVQNFEPQKYSQTDVENLIYGQPEEDKPLIRTLLRQLQAEALEGVENADERTKVLRMAWYVHTHFASVSIDPYTLRSALEYRQAECAASSTIFQMMVRSLGIKTRSTGFYGVPIQAAHTATEVFLDGAWRYIDPSFGVFFTQDGSLDGELISMDSLLTYRYAVATNTLYPIADGRLGWQDRDPAPTELPALFSPVQTDMISSGNYKLFLDETRAASPFDLGYEMVSEYAVDLAGERSVSLGTADHSIDDLRLHGAENNGLYDTAQLYFAGDYTGTYGPLLNSHVYRITGLRPGQTVRFRAGLYFGDPKHIQVTVRKGTLATLSREGDAIEAQINVLRRDIEIYVRVDDAQRVLFDYLRFQR